LPHLAKALGPLALALVISPRVMANSFAVATVIGVASTFIPAALATRGDIATKLRAL
jgi:ABC-type antimicrobial peptide transport system permease subunit